MTALTINIHLYAHGFSLLQQSRTTAKENSLTAQVKCQYIWFISSTTISFLQAEQSHTKRPLVSAPWQKAQNFTNSYDQWYITVASHQVLFLRPPLLQQCFLKAVSSVNHVPTTWTSELGREHIACFCRSWSEILLNLCAEGIFLQQRIIQAHWTKYWGQEILFCTAKN